MDDIDKMESARAELRLIVESCNTLTEQTRTTREFIREAASLIDPSSPWADEANALLQETETIALNTVETSNAASAAVTNISEATDSCEMLGRFQRNVGRLTRMLEKTMKERLANQKRLMGFIAKLKANGQP
ncbi:hypothetical protein Pan216_16110 [Planctomycetes bacterium Pan216]|uniref:Uncharacterized protein n=1 Tax=Kolteria novifilia TaxID=2527975 RepID=A0A518B1A4_9BACT|nr:hypothetical protein Pan216_16110 [Planctomycetes bacterium Pan216]